MSVVFGQVVIGPPGSGKTTYCHGMSQFLRSLGRKVAIVNIDPANDVVPYKADVDISSLITLEDVMDNLHLGPNGGLMYCMEYLEKNQTWLLEKINKFKDHYLLFDFPGQVELYTHHTSVKKILESLEKFNVRLCVVNLVDSHYCTDPGKYIAILLTSLCTMLQIGLPHVNILSKFDLMEKYGKLCFGVDFYTDVLDLDYLLDLLSEDKFTQKYAKLNAALVGLVQDYSLVSFMPLNINDKQCMSRVKNAVDKANGYVFGSGEERNVRTMLSCAMADDQAEIDEIMDKYGDRSVEDKTVNI